MYKSILSAVSLVLVLLTYFLGYQVQQSDFYPLILAYATFFGIYIWINRQKWEIPQIWFWVGLGVLLRFILLFALPSLSDDIYRFIWDGRLINQGINPFEYLPSYYINEYQGIPINGINPTLFDQLNSSEYFTIYPPIAQGVFAVATWLFPNSIWGSSLVMKTFLFGCECGTIVLLSKLFKEQLSTILWYVLNPLIILEICGNLHFEGAMVFFLLLAFYWLKKSEQEGVNTQKWFILSAISFACSVAAKLLPMMFLPFLIRPMSWKRSFQYYITGGVALILMFLPLVSGGFFSNFGDSLDLYFRRFEFNASLYYVFRWIGFQVSGYNQIASIGPMLALGALSGILYLSFQAKKNKIITLPHHWFWAICLYLLCTTTVHPWYTALPVVLCLFTNYRFPILWSGLIFLTYINYSYDEYHANLWIVAIEYSLVIVFFIWELKNYHKNRILE